MTKTPFTPSAETYSAIILCPNCSLSLSHNIEKGTTIKAYRNKAVCTKCGCSFDSYPGSYWPMQGTGNPYPNQYPEIICSHSI